MNKISFSIAMSAMWAPGLLTHQDWINWCQQPLQGDVSKEQPTIPSCIPTMFKRRFDFVGKMAVHVAEKCILSEEQIPVVYASRNGEVSRACKMLEAIAQEQPISPTAFSLSVHNAIAGLLSISLKNHENMSVIAADELLVEHAIIEATGLLQDGHKKVLCIVTNTPLPKTYDFLKEEQSPYYAFAWLIEKAKQNPIHLTWEESTEPLHLKPHYEQNLAVLQFYLARQARYAHITNGCKWTWSQHAYV